MWDKPEDDDPTQNFTPAESPADLKKKEAVQEYYKDTWRKEQQEQDKKIKNAEGASKIAGLTDIAGKIVTDYGNSQKQPVYLANRIQDLGKKQEAIEPQKQKWDNLQPTFDRQLDQAKTGRDEAFKGLQRDMSLEAADQDRNDKATNRELAAKQNDPQSEASKRAQLLARGAINSKIKEAEAAGDKDGAAQLRSMDVTGMSSAEAKNFYDSLKSTDYKDVLATQIASENRKSQAADREATRENTSAIREAAAGAKQKESEAKQTEKMEQLRVGEFGFAQTADDAKKLKDAVIVREKLNRQLNEIVALRQKHNGGAIWNRDDVATAKQLSTDAKLAYKDLVNLGVLSTSDTGMLDKILPDDPLEYNFSGLVGQDPTMTKIKNFQNGNEADFQKSMGLRLRREGRSNSVKTDDSTSKSNTSKQSFDWEQ